jgi:hypothetical protein
VSADRLSPADYTAAVDRLHALAHVTIALDQTVYASVCKLLSHLRLFLPGGAAEHLPADHWSRRSAELVAAVLLGHHDSNHPACLHALTRAAGDLPAALAAELQHPSRTADPERRPAGDPTDPRLDGPR